MNTRIMSFLVLFLAGKQLFSQVSETVLAFPTANAVATNSVVFIAGFDEGDNTYYINAKSYFESKGIKVVDYLFSMDEIVSWLNEPVPQTKVYDEIHIVSHSNPWLGMSLKTTEMGQRISVETLQAARAKQEIDVLRQGTNGATEIIFHSCGLGQNQALLSELKQVFTITEQPKVYASTLFNVFGGKFAGHYLARPYYGFYPTAESPGPAQLAKEFKTSYPNIKIDWFTALKTRQETMPASAYSYKFNIPLEYEFTFDSPEDIPQLADREAIMDWVSDVEQMAAVLLQFNIPIEKYRWKSKIVGNTLIIQGKTTVLCVLAPILQDEDSKEYRKPVRTNTALYQIL